MTTPRRLAAFVLLAAAFTPVASLAQTSEYFVMAGDQSKFHVLKGGVLLRSWGPASGTAQYQYPLVVTDVVRTMGANMGEIGAMYDLNGGDLVVRYTHPAVGPTRCWDGTTDGVNFFAIDTAGGVYRFDSTWSNPVRLFGAGSIGALTYDPTNSSLWVSQFSTMIVTEYSLTGSVLRSFSTGHTQNMALALDHADGTLWLHDRTTQGTFEQWSKSGTLLNRIPVAGMNTQNALGGEMSFLRVASCAFRNGTGVNPAHYACVTRPILGANWTTSYTGNANTLSTFLAVGVAGAATGPVIPPGELLLSLAGTPVIVAGTANITLPIPPIAVLAGAVLATQGMRLDNGLSGPQLFLLNAQDIQLGN